MTRSIGSALLVALGLMLFGLAVIEATGFRWIFIFGALLAVGVTGWHGVRSVFEGTFNVAAVLSTQTVLWYAIPFTYSGFVDYDGIVPTPFSENAASLTWITALCLLCYHLSKYIGATLELPHIRPAMLLSVTPIVLLQVALIATGNWGYSTLHEFAEGATSPPLLAQIANDFAPIVSPICGALIGSNFVRGKRVSRLVIAISVVFIMIEMIWFASVGRRPMTIVFAMMVIMGFRYAFQGRVTTKAIMAFAGSALLIAPFTLAAWDAYYTLRLATNDASLGGSVSILDLREARERAALYQGDDTFEENLLTRPFIINSVSEVSRGLHGLLWGESIYTQAMRAIPSALFPDKADLFGISPEDLWAKVANISTDDLSNTVILEGYVDFWFFGLPIYIVIFSAMIAGLAFFARRLQSPFVMVFAFFGFAFTFYNVETSLTEVFTKGRSMVMVMIIVVLWNLIRRSRRASPGPGHQLLV